MVPSEIRFLWYFYIVIVKDIFKQTEQRKEVSFAVKWGYRNEAQRNEICSETYTRPTADQLLTSRVPAVAFLKSHLKMVLSQLRTSVLSSGALEEHPCWEVLGQGSPGLAQAL